MREINRTIASGLIFSKDNKLLMGRKEPAKGGVYTDCWHIPGGGVNNMFFAEYLAKMKKTSVTNLVEEKAKDLGFRALV